MKKKLRYLHDVMKRDFSFLKGNFENIVVGDNRNTKIGKDFYKDPRTQAFPNPSVPLSEEEQTKVVLDAIEVSLKRAINRQAKNKLSPLGINNLFF